MSNELLNSTLTILRHILQTDATAKGQVMQLLNQQPEPLSELTVTPGGSITRKNIGAAALLKKKEWSNADRREAADLVKLPGDLKNFLTQNNML